MKGTVRAELVALGLIAGCGLVQAQTASGGAAAWVHVLVEETAQPSRVSVNLPLAVVEAVLEAAPQTLCSHGRVRIGLAKHHLELADLRRIWQELKNAGDTELVSVEAKDEQVKVARKGELVQIRVNEPGGEGVKIDLPVSLVDAALAGDGDELDVRALLRELQKHRGEIVRVNEKDGSVRIWIDETAAGAQGGK